MSVFDFFFAFLVFFTFMGLLLEREGLLLEGEGLLLEGEGLLLEGEGLFFAFGDRFTVSLCFLAL
jgi:hypothetical protein